MPLVYYPEIGRESALPVYLTGIGTDYLQQSVSRPTLTDPQLLISVSGTGVVTVEENGGQSGACDGIDGAVALRIKTAVKNSTQANKGIDQLGGQL